MCMFADKVDEYKQLLHAMVADGFVLSSSRIHGALVQVFVVCPSVCLSLYVDWRLRCS